MREGENERRREWEKGRLKKGNKDRMMDEQFQSEFTINGIELKKIENYSNVLSISTFLY